MYVIEISGLKKRFEEGGFCLDLPEMRVPEGYITGFIGENGAGKTTIIKLLCRLYQPDAGEILVNGHSIGDYKYSSYISQLSTLFQDFRLFAVSVEENIRNINNPEQEIGRASCRERV